MKSFPMIAAGVQTVGALDDGQRAENGQGIASSDWRCGFSAFFRSGPSLRPIPTSDLHHAPMRPAPSRFSRSSRRAKSERVCKMKPNAFISRAAKRLA
jgi:hypothetical protein